jgi:hypothetical protein
LQSVHLPVAGNQRLAHDPFDLKNQRYQSA